MKVYFSLKNNCRKNLFLLPILLIISCDILNAQDKNLQDQENYFGNRWEAIMSKNVSGSFRLLSFTAKRPSSYTKDDTLQIGFHLNDNVPVKINSTTIIQDNKNYQMLVENINWKIGWNTFQPWPIKDVLYSNSISSMNLAILIKRNDNVLIPAFVSTTGENSIQNNSYKFHFYTPANIKNLEYSVKNQKTGLKSTTTKLEDIDAGSSFLLPLMIVEILGSLYIFCQIAN